MSKYAGAPSPPRRHTLGAAQIVRAISDAAARWTHADFPPRVRATAAIMARTGYSEPVVDYALDQLFGSCAAPAFNAVIAGELGDLAALDGFIPRPGRTALYARGLPKSAILASQTTIGVALPAAMFALIAKSQVLVKDREDQLVGRFFATVVEEEPDLAGALQAESWPGTQTKSLDDMDVVVAFGRADTLKTIRSDLAAQTRFVGFGPRISCGILRLDAASDIQYRRQQLQAAARDVMLYEAQGCMSLHVLFVQTPANDRQLLERAALDMSDALEQSAIEFPPAQHPIAEALRHATIRSSLRFRAALHDDRCIEQPHSAVVFTHADPPPLQPGMLALVPINEAADIEQYLQKYHLRVEAVSIDPHDPSALSLALATGACRITPFGQLQQPYLQGEHGGRPRILDFVECVTSEIAL